MTKATLLDSLLETGRNEHSSTAVKWVEVFCTENEIVKIMLSYVNKIGYGLVVIMLPSHSFVKKDSNLEIIPSKWKPVFKLSSTNLLKLLRYVILQPNSALI